MAETYNDVWLKKLSKLLDTQFTIPGTNWKFGLDPILGLIPGAGDSISFLMQMGLVFMIAQRGISGHLAALLSINVLLDTLFGSIPIIGQAWDFWFKANERNLKLARQHWQEGKYQGSGWYYWVVMVLLLLATIAVVLYLIIVFFEWLISLF